MATPTIGLDITEFERSWKAMLERMEELPPRVQRTTGALQHLRSAFATIGVIGFVNSLSTAGREASELTRKLDRLDISNYADDFTHADAAARGFRGTIRDIAGAVSSIPVVGQVFDLITAPIKAAANALDSYRQVKREVGQAAAGSDALLQKLKGLEEQRAKVRADESDSQGFLAKVRVAFAGIGGNQDQAKLEAETQAQMRANSLKRIEKERLNLVNEITDAFDLENRARNSAIAGSQKESDLAAIELVRREKIAALTEQVKNSLGLKSKEGEQSLATGTDKINTEAEARVGLAERQHEITISTFKVQSETASNALKGSFGQMDSAKAIYDLAVKTYNLTGGLGEEQQMQEKAKVDLANAAYQQSKLAVSNELSELRIQTAGIEARSKGLKSVAEQSRIIAQYDTQIARLKGVENAEAKEAIKLLEKQKALAQRDADAVQHDETPADRRKARHVNQVLNRKAKQQRERDVAALRGRNGGLVTGGLGVGANPHGPGLRTGGLNDPSVSFAAQEARAKATLQQQGAKMQIDAYNAVMDIARAVKSDK